MEMTEVEKILIRAQQLQDAQGVGLDPEILRLLTNNQLRDAAGASLNQDEVNFTASPERISTANDYQREYIEPQPKPMPYGIEGVNRFIEPPKPNNLLLNSGQQPLDEVDDVISNLMKDPKNLNKLKEKMMQSIQSNKMGNNA